MKPSTHTLKGLFESDVRYLVPLYQRPYVWTEEDHWAPLWEDIKIVLEHYEQNGSGGSDDAYSHFLGALVLDLENVPPGRAMERLVIDGQQRLTTLQLLLAAAKTVADDAGAGKEARLLQKLIRNDPDIAAGESRFKVWPTNANRKAFRHAMEMAMEGAVQQPDDPNNKIQEAEIFFRKEINDWVRDGEPSAEALEERFTTLRVSLTELLNVVAINLEPGDNPQVIFETLNARGTPLLAMDLVKNAAFLRASKEDGDVDELHNDVWEPQLGDPYWRKKQRQGRLNRPRAELFLMHWLAAELGQIIPATELFSTFRTNMLDVPERPAMDELIRRLNADAETYRSFSEQKPGTVEEQFFRNLEALDTTTVIPIALLLYRSKEADLRVKRRTLQMLESWLVRRMVCSYTTKNYNNIAAELLVAAKADPKKADEAVRELLLGYDAPLNVWPEDAELEKALTSRDLYGYVSQKRVSMLLSAIELRIRKSNKVEDIYTIPGKPTIEHIMPVRWKRAWPLPKKLPEDEAIERRNTRLNQIGNLTLLTGPLNSSLSNGRWDRKKAGIDKHALLLMNRPLVKLKKWDEAAIDKRTKELFRDIKAIWPGPDSKRWAS